MLLGMKIVFIPFWRQWNRKSLVQCRSDTVTKSNKKVNSFLLKETLLAFTECIRIHGKHSLYPIITNLYCIEPYRL